MKPSIQQLNTFLGKAALATYAGGGDKTESKEPGFIELEYKEGDLYYKDSYCGYFQSWGRETVWFEGKPLWTQIYGGGMTEPYLNDDEFAHTTFTFLKKALSDGEKENDFQPRGPSSFKDGDWGYACEWEGDITRFKGSETITFKGEIVFTHNFIGGLVLAKE